ncbi:hypothetical protein P691DRAFT_170325 [Macrolepiota fuliginosa MF-IS2]|uniref:Uncharacterized protein n=1 Tax=Macrolepiota fuliginosa MF-IS2 TaxID=1400762 RepID=A0A9P5X9N5_9AGAR|nr:hypothetical protein P691DRAFT_170325 [Macrolepiota fuliginosa MF-IS2]
MFFCCVIVVVHAPPGNTEVVVLVGGEGDGKKSTRLSSRIFAIVIASSILHAARTRILFVGGPAYNDTDEAGVCTR